jgi:NADH-quinone oxidoreductase subunit N
VQVHSLAGVPQLVCFWAKYFVYLACYQAGALLPVIVGIAMTIVSLYYYLRFLKAMWMNPASSAEPIVTPRAMNATLIASTVLVLLLGLFPNVVWNILSQATLVAGR